MFKKNSDGNYMSKNAQGDQFPKNTEFVLDEELFTVTEAFETDNTPCRRIRSKSTGEDTIMTLYDLQRDSERSKGFAIVKPLAEDSSNCSINNDE